MEFIITGFSGDIFLSFLIEEIGEWIHKDIKKKASQINVKPVYKL